MKSEGVDDNSLREAIETKSELDQVCKIIYENTYGSEEDTDNEIVEEKITSIIPMEELWEPTKA